MPAMASSSTKVHQPEVPTFYQLFKWILNGGRWSKFSGMLEVSSNCIKNRMIVVDKVGTYCYNEGENSGKPSLSQSFNHQQSLIITHSAYSVRSRQSARTPSDVKGHGRLVARARRESLTGDG
jgi:hypothetical protein